MNVPFFFARRYLFAKKSRNIIHFISLISMVIVAFVTAAMISVMSAFSGIEQLVEKLFSTFDAELTIVPATGRSFADSLIVAAHLEDIPGVALYSPVIEEDAWLIYNDQNTVATIKGVRDDYTKLSPIDSMMFSGEFVLQHDSVPFAVPGLGVRSELGIAMGSPIPPLITINAPIKGRKLSRYRENAFQKASIHISGVFSVNAELDIKYVFVPLEFAKELFGMENESSAVEIKLDPNAKADEVKAILQSRLPELKVLTRYDKNALVYKTNASEKWATFLILLFILIIAFFNIIASLTMLIIEKKNDILLLTSMGADNLSIERIFILQGIFINLIGAASGVCIGTALCWAQQKFGLISMEGAMVQYYPVVMNPIEILGIFIIVLFTGSLFSVGMVRSLMKRFVKNADLFHS
jgi:lipoprotein-releasing system permease protein